MLNLIIADDEQIIRSALSEMIDYASLGYHLVGCAKNGMEALNLIMDYNPDVVISDIKMPILDGLALIEQASKLDSHPEFIILSGYGEFEYAKKAMQYGIKHYLLKPTNRNELISALISIRTEYEKHPISQNLTANTQTSFSTPGESLVRKCKLYVEHHFSSETLSLKWLAQNYCYVSIGYLSKQFVKSEGIRFSDYLNQLRVHKAKEYILYQGEHNIKNIAAQVGFASNPQYFGQVFKKYEGITPSEYILTLSKSTRETS
ncbi:MAG: response regulator [Clostridiales bacterium]|nr:response regulator [Clostridiales bacterium]